MIIVLIRERDNKKMVLNNELLLSFITALTSFASGSPVYLHGHTGVGTPSFNRQHFSPHPWSASTQGLLILFCFLYLLGLKSSIKYSWNIEIMPSFTYGLVELSYWSL